MPTYDFVCENCGYIEIHHSIHDEHPDKCPQCKSGDITRTILTVPPIKYIGRGHIDDWKSTRVDPQRPTSPESNTPYD